MPQSKSLVVRTVRPPSRAAILTLYDAGCTTLQVSNQLQISPAWARRVKQQRAESGQTVDATTRVRVTKWAPHADAIRAAVERTPDLTLDQLHQRLKLPLSCTTLQVLRLSLKKKS